MSNNVVMPTDCSESSDSSGNLVYNCSGHYFGDFPINIPTKTLILILRETMTAPTAPSFQAIGLLKLQIPDLSFNGINRLSIETFKNMELLLSLGI